MNPQIQAFLRRWVPQAGRDLGNRLLGRTIRFSGSYESWEAATNASLGYDNGALIARLHAAALAIRSGHGAWEQDGIVRESVPADFPLLACFGRIGLSVDAVDVLDLGGGFGSSLFQIERYLPELSIRAWNVVEQPALAEIGMREFARTPLRFFESVEDCLATTTPNVALLSSVLQYLPNPLEMLEQLREIEFLVIDRNPCSTSGERITVQVIPKSIYRASYPCWLLDWEKLRAQLTKTHTMLMVWQGKDPTIFGSHGNATFNGSIWRRSIP